MAIMTTPLMIYTIASLLLTSCAQTCQNYKFPGNRFFSSCTDLQVLRAHLHWTQHPSNQTVEVAYRAKQTPRGWIAWGINPTYSGMIGTQALVAFQDPEGKMRAYSTEVTDYSTSLRPGPLSFPVSEVSAEYLNDEMIIFAVLGPLSNDTAFNIVWQAGNSVLNGVPQPHPFFGSHLRSVGTLDLLSA